MSISLFSLSFVYSIILMAILYKCFRGFKYIFKNIFYRSQQRKQAPRGGQGLLGQCTIVCSSPMASSVVCCSHGSCTSIDIVSLNLVSRVKKRRHCALGVPLVTAQGACHRMRQEVYGTSDPRLSGPSWFYSTSISSLLLC